MIKRTSRLPKSHRLHLKKEVEFLFSNGSRFRITPFNIIYCFFGESKPAVKMAVSVPKKNIRLAVDRNRIKRQIREIYRTNIHETSDYLEKKKISIQIMFVYTGKVSPDYAVLKSKIILILQRLVKEHEEGIV